MAVLFYRVEECRLSRSGFAGKEDITPGVPNEFIGELEFCVRVFHFQIVFLSRLKSG
jgi:hypothetical protein